MKLFTKRAGITINVSTEAVVRAIVLVILAVLALKFVGRVGYQLQLLVTAAFLALALNPAVMWIARKLRTKSRVLATGVAYVIVLVLLLSFLAIVVPPLVEQSITFVREIPNTVARVKTEDTAVGRFVHHYNLDAQIDVLSHDINGRIGNLPSTLWGLVNRIGGTLISVITVLVLTFMMLVEGPVWIDRIWGVTDPGKRKHRQELARRMYRVVTGYVNGQVVIAAIAAGFALIALLIASTATHAQVNAIALAGIVFLFGLIPLIGNTLAAVVVVIVCLFASMPLALIMAVFFPIYQQIENVTISPHIQSKGSQLTPLLVFTAALVGVGFGGLLGAFVAIPAAGCIRILVEDHFSTQLPTKKTVATSKK